MIKTADQILADLSPTHALREAWVRKTKGPPEPCQNAYRGCGGMTGTKRSGRGLCERCYNRWSRWGDSWGHSPNVGRCTKRNCFLGHNREPEVACAISGGSAPCRPVYFCPTAGEYESPCHGGFDTCCVSPELHREAR